MERRLVMVVLVSLVALAAQLAVAQDAAREPTDVQPGLVAENASLDIGEVKAGTEAVGTFILRNTSASAIKIIRAKPS